MCERQGIVCGRRFVLDNKWYYYNWFSLLNYNRYLNSEFLLNNILIIGYIIHSIFIIITILRTKASVRAAGRRARARAK